MGCNICRFNREVYVEKEFNYPNNENKEKEEINQIEDKLENSLNKQNNKKDKELLNEKNNAIDNNMNKSDKIDKIDNLINNSSIPNSQENKLKSKKYISPPISPQRINNESDKDKNDITTNININKDKENTKIQINNLIIKKEIINTNIILNNNNSNNNNEVNTNSINDDYNLLKNTKEDQKRLNYSQSVLSFQKNDYNTRIIDLINKIRTNPQEYSKTVLDNIQYIRKKVIILADEETGQNDEKIEIFFQKKVKVELYKGEIAFIKAAKFLQNLKPMNELIYNENIKINIPDNILLMNDKLTIKNELNFIKNQFNITAFFKDNIKNPEIGLLLMIVGDYKNSENKKRNAILNPDNKYIGINSKFIGNSFISYFTFSK